MHAFTYFLMLKDWEVGLETLEDGVFSILAKKILYWEDLLGTLGDAEQL
jgi:hypothetical protein